MISDPFGDQTTVESSPIAQSPSLVPPSHCLLPPYRGKGEVRQIFVILVAFILAYKCGVVSVRFF